MKPSSALRGVSALVVGSLLTLALVRCAAPTQVRVTVRTDECTSGSTTTITVGVLGGIETKDPGPSSSKCEPGNGGGRIGQLVVQPSDAKDADFAFKVVTGVGSLADACKAPDYKGCIVARRALRFLPHEDLEVVVDMRRSCLDNPCDPSSTCVKGICRSARISDPSGCKSGAPCGEEALASGAPPSEDGGTDGAVTDGAVPDGGLGDGAVGDGAVDAGAAGMVLVEKGNVRFDSSGKQGSFSRPYYLDKQEVSVGRFKAWIAAGKPPPCPVGNCDMDPGGPYSGRMQWNAQWTLDPAFTEPTWERDGPTFSCSSAPAALPVTRTFARGDELPVNCVSFYHAAAFCAWEGKRLPTWLEWQIAWVGRDGQRRHPWGPEAIECSRANTSECDAGVLAVGTLGAGATPDGVLHLGGNVAERVWDVPMDGGAAFVFPSGDVGVDYLGTSAPCGLSPCIGVRLGSWRESRGFVDPTKMRAERLEASDATGFRCAKTGPR